MEGMKEYIEIAAIIDLITRRYEQPEFCTYEINSIPAADVAEVRHGYWIDLNTENSTGPLFKCSECSHLHNPNRNDLDLERVELKPLYCDACGARMDKEDEHEAG